ncbi:hypothetical protein FRC02_002320 [Tulasnella sp. 418]|nr:hypothetical protein FRC02_002320 [Tulasnella sp. 418]
MTAPIVICCTFIFIVLVAGYFFFRRRGCAESPQPDLEAAVNQAPEEQKSDQCADDRRASLKSFDSRTSTLVGCSEASPEDFKQQITVLPYIATVAARKIKFPKDTSPITPLPNETGALRTNLLVLHTPNPDETFRISVRRDVTLSELMSTVHLRLVATHGLFELHRLPTPMPGVSQIVTDDQLSGFLEIYRHAEAGHLYLVHKDD